MAKQTTGAKSHMAVDLMAAMSAIPKDKLDHINVIAKSAKARVAKADGDAPEGEMQDDGLLGEDAQNALKAAFRILAPFSDDLSANTLADFADALGVQADEEPTEDPSEDPLEDAQKADGEEDKEEDDVNKADDDDKEDDDVNKADDDKEDEDEEAQKAADEEVKDEADAEDVPPSVAKADGMPSFADASDSDLEAAMAAARTAYAEAMRQRGLSEEAQKAEDTDAAKDEDEDELNKSAIAKSAASLSLKGLSKAQRKILEPVFKSQMSRFAALEKAHRALINKSAQLSEEMQRREFVAKAAREYSALGSPDEIGASMMRLHKKDPEGLASWERIMKAANAQMRQGGAEGLFAELGSSMSNTASEGEGAEAKIAQSVDAMVQKSDKTREQIEAQFLSTPAGRALYAQAQREKRN